MIFNSFAGLIVIEVSVPMTDVPRNRMTELVTYGSVGSADPCAAAPARQPQVHLNAMFTPSFDIFLRKQERQFTERLT